MCLQLDVRLIFHRPAAQDTRPTRYYTLELHDKLRETENWFASEQRSGARYG